jgi:hypothetical protein
VASAASVSKTLLLAPTGHFILGSGDESLCRPLLEICASERSCSLHGPSVAILEDRCSIHNSFLRATPRRIPSSPASQRAQRESHHHPRAQPSKKTSSPSTNPRGICTPWSTPVAPWRPPSEQRLKLRPSLDSSATSVLLGCLRHLGGRGPSPPQGIRKSQRLWRTIW